MQKYFTEVVDDSPKVVPLTDKQEPELVKSLWTDPKTNHTYEITEKKALGPNADYSMEQRAREIAMQRARQQEPPRRDEQRDQATTRYVPESDFVDYETELRKRALRDARFELGNTREKALPEDVDEDGIRKPEMPYNMRGLNEDIRFYNAPKDALLWGVGPASSRPKAEGPNITTAQRPRPEDLSIKADKQVVSQVFRSMMASIASEKTRTTGAEASKKQEIEGLLRNLVDSGIDRNWTAPETLKEAKPDSVAISVGRRALECINTAKTVPEFMNMSTSEKDSIMLAVGRTMLNLAVTGPTANKTSSDVESPLVNDITKKKILSALDSSIVMKALGPELMAMTLRTDKPVNTLIKPAEGNARNKVLPTVETGTRKTTETQARAQKPSMETFFRDDNTNIKDELALGQRQVHSSVDLPSKRNGTAILNRMFRE
jgi:hypothetical protein